MNDKSPESQLAGQSTRLLRLRIPLMAFLALNAALIVSVPFVRSDASNDGGKHQVAVAKPAAVRPAAPPDRVVKSPDKPLVQPPPTVDIVPPQTSELAPPRVETPTQPAVEPPNPNELLRQQQRERQAAARREMLAWSRVVAEQAADSTVSAALDAPRALSKLLADGTAKFVQLAATARNHPDVTIAHNNPDPTSTIKSAVPSVEIPAEPDGLVVVNPSESGGEVYFLANGTVYHLQPGQSQSFTHGGPWLIHFHRGDSFGNATYQVSRGKFTFHVTPRGWELSQVSASKS